MLAGEQAATLIVEGILLDGPPCSCAAISSPPQILGLPKQSTVCSMIVASDPHVTPCSHINIQIHMNQQEICVTHILALR